MAKLSSFQELGDVLEPFDPNYISNKAYEIPQISAYEKRFFHKVSILEKKLRQKGISIEWMERWECFRVHKYIGGSDYPTYRYVRVNMDENDYSFGTEKEDLVFDGRASVVVDAVFAWVNSGMVKKVLAMKATELMKEHKLSKRKFISMFEDGTIYSLYDGEIEFDI